MNMIRSAKNQIAELTAAAYRAAVQEGLLPFDTAVAFAEMFFDSFNLQKHDVPPLFILMRLCSG